MDKGLAWYQSHFPLKNSSVLTGESTPAYLFHPEVPKRVKSLIPTIKLIVLLRDPIERAYSAFKMGQRMGIDPLKTFQKAIDRELSWEQKGLHKDYTKARHNLAYLARSNYAQQIQHWLTFFPKEQFLFLKSESFFENAENSIIKVNQFLQLSDFLPQDLKPKNTSANSSIDSKIKESLKQYFFDQNEQLVELLGEEFSW